MFKATIKAAAKAKGVKNYYQLGVLLAPNGEREAKFEMMAKRLWSGAHVPTLPTLALVCDALGCELSDVLVRVAPKKNGRKRSSAAAMPKAKPKPRR